MNARTLAGVLPLLILTAAAAERFAEVYEPIWKFEHNKQVFTNAFLVKVGERDGFVKLDSGMVRIRLDDLPEPLRTKYWLPREKEIREKFNASMEESLRKAERKLAEKQQEEERDRLMAENSVREQRVSAQTAAAKAAAENYTAGFLAISMLCLYVLPSFVAWKDKHRNLSGVVIVNLFLGWTLIGWVVALVWAVHKDARGQPG